jgi:hypothetical protein
MVPDPAVPLTLSLRSHRIEAISTPEKKIAGGAARVPVLSSFCKSETWLPAKARG